MSNRRVRLASANWSELFESPKARHQARRVAHQKDEAMALAPEPVAGGAFLGSPRIAVIIVGKRDGTLAFSQCGPAARRHLARQDGPYRHLEDPGQGPAHGTPA